MFFSYVFDVFIFFNLSNFPANQASYAAITNKLKFILKLTTFLFATYSLLQKLNGISLLAQRRYILTTLSLSLMWWFSFYFFIFSFSFFIFSFSNVICLFFVQRMRVLIKFPNPPSFCTRLLQFVVVIRAYERPRPTGQG